MFFLILFKILFISLSWNVLSEQLFFSNFPLSSNEEDSIFSNRFSSLRPEKSSNGINELSSILKYSTGNKYLSKENIEIVLDSLERAKMLQPINPLNEEKNYRKEEDQTQKNHAYNSVNVFNNFKSFFRMQYMRNEELQKEFHSLVFCKLPLILKRKFYFCAYSRIISKKSKRRKFKKTS
jgi:hypothetical protein